DAVSPRTPGSTPLVPLCWPKTPLPVTLEKSPPSPSVDVPRTPEPDALPPLTPVPPAEFEPTTAGAVAFADRPISAYAPEPGSLFWTSSSACADDPRNRLDASTLLVTPRLKTSPTP